MTARSLRSRSNNAAQSVFALVALATVAVISVRSVGATEPFVRRVQPPTNVQTQLPVPPRSAAYSRGQIHRSQPRNSQTHSHQTAPQHGSHNSAVAVGQDSAPSRGLFSFGKSDERKHVIAGLPLNRLTEHAKTRILRVANSPTIFRRLPPHAIDCDQDMFLFLSRNPEVLVGMWDLMGVTNVQIKRIGPYQLEASDGSGTRCVVDLVYGDATRHIFVATGEYSGTMVTAPIRGEGVFVLNSSYAKSSSGGTTVTGSIDCFVKFDGIGADLVARTLSGIIGRSAESNFSQTANFVSQVSQASQRNPPAMLDIAGRLPQVEHPTRRQFARTISNVAQRYSDKQAALASPVTFPVAQKR